MIGELYKNTSRPSLYQPSQEVAEVTKLTRDDYAIGDEILNTPWEELNGETVITRMNTDQRRFNAYVEEESLDPSENWKWRGTRSMARNKAMAMHAHLTANYIVPLVTAQNDFDEEDRDMSNGMHDSVEWLTINSNYRPSFLLTSMGMLVNPVTYMDLSWMEVYQTIKEKQENGEYIPREILDEVLSGLNVEVRSADQILITNAHQQNIQRQRCVIKRRYIEYSEAEQVYGEHPHWGFVQPGIRAIYNDKDGLFYEIKDDDHPYLVEEVTAHYRSDDTEIVYLNGIYFGDENVDANPMKHRDNRNAPKVPLVPFGYERINEHFFFYKSLMNRVGWDDMLLDAMYETTMNKELLNLNLPMAITGEEEVDTDIVFPGSVVAFANADTKVTPLLPPSNPAAGYAALNKIEESISADSSLSDLQMGQMPEASQKAFNVARAEQNARILLSGVGKTLGESVGQVGQLMIDIAINNLTVAQVEEMQGGETKLKYRTLLLEDQMVGGRKVSKIIRFDESLMGMEMGNKEMEDANLDLLTEAKWPEGKRHIYRINPMIASKMKYLVRVDPDAMFPRNQIFQQEVEKELYTLLRADPLAEPETLVRRLVGAFHRGEEDEYITKKTPAIMGGGMPVTPEMLPAKGGNKIGNLSMSSPAGAMI